jgi:hypothetical protein
MGGGGALKILLAPMPGFSGRICINVSTSEKVLLQRAGGLFGY